MSDYRVKAKIVNNNIISAMEALGIKNAAELSRIADMEQGSVGDYINMKTSPMKVDGTLKVGAEKLCFALNKMPDELFNEQQMYSPVKENKVEIKMEHPALEYNPIDLLTDEIDAQRITDHLTGALTMREQKIIDLRFGLNGHDEHTYEDAGKHFGVTKERIRQLEHRAMRKMRHPGRQL